LSRGPLDVLCPAGLHCGGDQLAPSRPPHGRRLFGTIIALERAVALGRPWGYAAPFFGAVSAVLLLFSAPLHIAAFFLFLSSLALLVIFGVFLNRQAADFTVIMALGAVVWAVGNFLLFRGWLVPHVVPWWAGFLILTIAGERIEMSRLRPRTPRSEERRVGKACRARWTAEARNESRE